MCPQRTYSSEEDGYPPAQTSNVEEIQFLLSPSQEFTQLSILCRKPHQVSW